MDYNSKTFWKYVWHDQIKPSNWLRSSTFYEYIMIITIMYAVIFTNLSLQKKSILFMGFLVGISALKFYSLFKSGAHMGWNRERYGKYTKSQLKKYKLGKKNEEKI